MQYTDNYSLKKPERGVEPHANIEDLNYNTDVIDRALADDRQISLLMYDSTSTYNTGDIVGYENPTTHRIRAFRCLEDNVTGPWDVTKWAQTTLAAEIKNGGGGTDVEANPSGTATADLEKLRVGQTIYGLPTDMTGATSQAAGAHGLVPAPSAGDEGKVLYGDGTWKTPQSAPSNLGDLGDVTLTTPTEGQILTYDGDDWVNADAPDVDVTKTASGNPIEVSDSANAPLVKCVTQITGYQSGTGTPSPDNIRPITAYTEGEIVVRGHNIWNEDWEQGSINKDTGANASVTSGIRSKNYVPVKPNTEYHIIQKGTDSGNLVVYFYAEDKSFIIYTGTGAYQNGYNGSTGKFTTPSNAAFIRFRTASNYGNTYNNDIAINYPSNVNEYEPYKGTQHTAQFSNSIYQGNADFVGGSVESKWKKITISSGIQLYGNYGDDNAPLFYFDIPIMNVSAYANTSYPAENKPICNIYNAITSASDTGMHDMEFRTRAQNPTNRFYCRDSRFTTAQEFNDYIAQNPIEIAYKLATPTTSSVTPTNFPVKSLSGYSHIESSTGEMEVEYIAKAFSPITELVDSQISALQKMMELMLTSARETEMKATQNYTAGDLLIVSGKLYKASSNIANGSTLVINSNVTSTTIAAELAALA